MLARGIKCQVSWPGARHGSHDLWIAAQSSARRIELVHQQLIEPHVRNNYKAIVGRKHGGVSVRPLLALFIHARSFMLDERRGFTEAAVPQQRKYGDASAIVIGNQRVFAAAIQRNVRGPFTARWNLIQWRKLRSLWLDGERAHRPGGLPVELRKLVDGVEESSARGNREK